MKVSTGNNGGGAHGINDGIETENINSNDNGVMKISIVVMAGENMKMA